MPMLERQSAKTMIDFEGDTAFTHRTLDAMQSRTEAVFHNIANQNVPGFKRVTVKFEELLREAVENGSDPATVKAVVERDTSGPPGQNNVELMDELALLGKAQMLHDYMLRRAGGYFASVNKAIQGR